MTIDQNIWAQTNDIPKEEGYLIWHGADHRCPFWRNSTHKWQYKGAQFQSTVTGNEKILRCYGLVKKVNVMKFPVEGKFIQFIS